MYLPQQNQISKSKNYINVFGGYNHQSRISDAEFYDMKNMTADQYPVLSVRDPRTYKLKIASSEYEPASGQIMTKYVEESLSRRYAMYIIKEKVEGGSTYELEYTVNKDYVKSYEQKLTYMIRGQEFKYLSPTGKTITTPEESTEMTITIIAEWNGDEKAWTEENIEKYVYDIHLKKRNETIRGMVLKDGKLAYLIKNSLYWNGNEYDFSEYKDERKQQLISYGAYILIFPMGVYLNTKDTTDRGYLGKKSENKIKTSYSVCNLHGAEYDYILSETAPEEPENGQYWMKKAEGADALYQWSESMAMWTAISTTYIKIKATNNAECFEGFGLNDAIFIEGSDVEELNGVNTIAAMGKDEKDSYIVVTGILNTVVDQRTPVTFERRIPDLDYVCVSNNRVWGCFYGETKEGSVNEIYACKLGDPKNWYSYQGTAQDSYALSLGDDGEFTGAYTYQGYPLFFKENNIYKVYGTYPAAYQLTTYDCRGVQKGSSKSIAIVDEYLVYKSDNDVCVFDGNYPMSLSAKLGKRKFKNCCGGAYMSKYYACMEEDGKASIYVYDFSTSTWMKDADLKIIEFVSTKSGELYGRTKTGVISFGTEKDSLGMESETETEMVEWFVESGEYGMDSSETKRITEIKIRAAVYFGSRMKLEVEYDNSGKWIEQWNDKGGVNGDGKIKLYYIPIRPVPCDIMRIRLSGVGKVEIYSIEKKVET